LKFKKCKQKSFERYIWEYKRGDYEKLINDIQATNWNNCFDTGINIYTNKMADKLIDIAKDCIPNKMIYVRSSDVPLMTSTIRSHKRIHKLLYKKAKVKQTTSHWQKFRQFRNKLSYSSGNKIHSLL
jgi:hypothetical protein